MRVRYVCIESSCIAILMHQLSSYHKPLLCLQWDTTLDVGMIEEQIANARAQDMPLDGEIRKQNFEPSCPKVAGLISATKTPGEDALAFHDFQPPTSSTMEKPLDLLLMTVPDG